MMPEITPEISTELRQIAVAMDGDLPAESLDELVERKRREQGIVFEEPKRAVLHP